MSAGGHAESCVLSQMSMEGAKGGLSRAGRSPEQERQGTVFLKDSCSSPE